MRQLKRGLLLLVEMVGCAFAHNTNQQLG